MTMSLSLCGAQSGTLPLASGIESISRAGMHQPPYLSSSHCQPHIWTLKNCFLGVGYHWWWSGQDKSHREEGFP